MEATILPTMSRLEAQHWWFRARLDLIAAITAERLHAGSRLLDIGCGTGLFLDRLRSRLDGWGLDPSPAAVAYCRERGLHHVRQGGVEQLTDAALGAFDAVSMWDVLEHVADDHSALVTVRSVLQPGGVLFLSVPAYRWLWAPHDTLHHHHRRYSHRALSRRLHGAGFHIESLAHFNAYLLPVAIVERAVSRMLGRATAMRVPPRFVNELLYGIFKSERRRLTGRPMKGYPFGLSLLAVATRT